MLIDKDLKIVYRGVGKKGLDQIEKILKTEKDEQLIKTHS